MNAVAPPQGDPRQRNLLDPSGLAVDTADVGTSKNIHIDHCSHSFVPLDLADHFLSPCAARVSTPKAPRNSSRTRVAIVLSVEALALFVDLMSSKEADHALDGLWRQLLAVCKVTRTGNTDHRTAPPELATPRQSLFSFVGGILRRNEVHTS